MENTPPTTIQTNQTPGIPSAFKLLEEAWNIYKERFRTILDIAAPGFLVSLLPSILWLIPGIPEDIKPGLRSGLAILSASVGVLINIALLVHICHKTGFRESYKKSAHFFFPYIGLTVLAGLVTLGGLVLLIIPGIMAALYLTFSTYILISQDVKIKEALAKSWIIARGNIRQIGFKILFIFIPIIMVEIFLDHFLLGESGMKNSGIMQDTFNPRADFNYAAIDGAIMSLFFSPIILIYVYQFYGILKKLREGKDMSQELESAKKRIRLFFILGCASLLSLLALFIWITITWGPSWNSIIGL